MTARHRILFTVVGLIVVGLLGGGEAAAETRRVARESAAAFPLDGESTLRVEGVAGEIRVRAGGDPDIRYLARGLDDRDLEIEVDLSLDGGTVILSTPTALADGVPVLLEVVAAADLSVEIEAHDTLAFVSGIAGDVEIVGERLDARIANVGGDAEIDTAGGKVTVGGLAGSLDLTAKGKVEVDLGQLGAAATVRAEGGTVTVDRVRGVLDLDLDGATATVADAARPVRVSARGGRVELTGLAEGGTLDLVGTEGRVVESGGDLDVRTDAPFHFESCSAPVHVESYGGQVSGAAQTGPVEIVTDNAPVRLETVEGELRVQGDRLQVDISDITAPSWIDTTYSDVIVRRAGAPVHVRGEFGDVLVDESKGEVIVENRDGNVTIRGLSSSATIEGGGPSFVVEWAAVQGSKDSTIVNDAGDVAVVFGGDGGVRVDAESRYGVVRSTIEGLGDADVGRTLRGALRGGRGPAVRIVAEGDVVLSGSGDAIDGR